MDILLIIIEWLLFVPLTLCVLYLFIFALFSHCRSKFIDNDFTSKKQHRYLILFPAYKEDSVILKSVASFFRQNYPKELFDVMVISDQMQEETNIQLKNIGAKVLVAQYENSSKAKALKLAMEATLPSAYDAVVIMDADNITIDNFLNEINSIYSQGYNAIQAHRTSDNLQTDIAILDAVSEEINNGFFRSGHNALGLSAALSGSGMVISEAKFRKYVLSLETSGEDKELEALILKNGDGPIVYAANIPVYDEKVQKTKAISNQRRRWIAAQFGALANALPNFPKALVNGNIDYCDKTIQWMLPPRLIQLSAVFGLTILFSILNFETGIKWLILSFLQIAAMLIPVPASFYNWKLLKALIHIPTLAFTMILNLFKLKGANKKFIHTEHGS